MQRDASPTFQERAKNIPNPVATAFPPLPLSHIGQICPEIADIPALTSINPWSLNYWAIFTAIRPFPTSIINTKSAGHLPTFLKTFVAPVDPEPIVLRSIFLRYFPIKKPVGIDPKR